MYYSDIIEFFSEGEIDILVHFYSCFFWIFFKYFMIYFNKILIFNKINEMINIKILTFVM